jgi:hypothetical protein
MLSSVADARASRMPASRRANPTKPTRAPARAAHTLSGSSARRWSGLSRESLVPLPPSRLIDHGLDHGFVHCMERAGLVGTLRRNKRTLRWKCLRRQTARRPYTELTIPGLADALVLSYSTTPSSIP